MPNVIIGLERCLAQPPDVLRHGRFGLLMNQASVDRHLRYACDGLAEAFPWRLGAIFSPQHGLWGTEQANMLESPHGRHPRLDVPVYSLYSETRRPTAAMLDGLEALVVDLQDVGTRVYTFVWTVSHCLEACAEAGVPVILLDRPNPLGAAIEGPLLEDDVHSFVGRAAIPMRHGLTLGELARLINVERRIGADVSVVPMHGWRREMPWSETGRSWIPPSPNLPTFASALAYPGEVLLEGTNLSEGRGTTTPFELAGAPFIDPFPLTDALARFELPGVTFRPVWFTPTFDKWTGTSCGGVFLHVTDANAFRPYRSTVAIIAAVRELWPDAFQFSDPPYEYEPQHVPIDLISGSSRLRERLLRDLPLSPGELESLCSVDETAWRQRTESSLLY